MELKKNLHVLFSNILTFDDVMFVFFLIYVPVRRLFTHWHNSEVQLVLTQGFCDDGTAGVP